MEETTSIASKNVNEQVAVAHLLSRSAQIAAYGGFNLVASLIEDAGNLNPDTAAKRNIFLTDTSKKHKRLQLEKTLSLWSEILSITNTEEEIISRCEQRIAQLEQTIDDNLTKVVSDCRVLETSYGSIQIFFANAGTNRIKNCSFINCTPGQLKDIEEPTFMEAVKEEFTKNFDRLDLRNNYSIFVLPGYLSKNSVLEKWAKVAHDHKLTLVTDFENVDESDDLMELFESAAHTSDDLPRSNIIMTCNWLVGRGRYEELGEEDDLYLPPSCALAGKVYSTLMSQVAAGKKFGIIKGADGVKFPLKKNEISSLEKMGLVPMTKENGVVMAFSAKTLFNGNNLGLQTYSVVRVFDYVSKVLIDFLNRRAFENFNANTRKDLMAQVVKFLDSVTGPEKLIEDFSIKRFEQDSVQKDKIYVDVHMKPYFPAKNCMLKLEGQRGEDTTSWNTDYNLQGN